MAFKVGDRAVYKGEKDWPEMTRIYGGDFCTILEVRGTPFDDCRVAFDRFPNCNHREHHNWFYVDQKTLEPLTQSK